MVECEIQPECESDAEYEVVVEDHGTEFTHRFCEGHKDAEKEDAEADPTTSVVEITPLS